MSGVDDLLLELQEAVGCDYLSDLPRIYKVNPQKILDEIAKVPAGKYSLEDWNRAADYFKR